jgi:hypothetical protein
VDNALKWRTDIKAVSLANAWAPISPIDFLVKSTRGSRMLTALMVLLGSLGLICGGHRAVELEIVNLTLIAGEWLVTREEIKTGR